MLYSAIEFQIAPIFYLSHLENKTFKQTGVALDRPISNFRGVGGIFQLLKNIMSANSEHTNQTPHTAVSGLGLHCLLIHVQ